MELLHVDLFGIIAMFLTVRKYKSGYKYLFLMKSEYDKETRKDKKVIVKNFGNYDVFIREHPDEYAKLVECYGDKKEKFKTEKEQTLNKFFDSELNLASSALTQLKCVMPQNYSHLFLRKIWKDELQMHKYFDYITRHEGSDIEFSPTEIGLYFSTLKITSPCSYLAGLEQSPRFLGDPMADYTSDDVYRCLHFLAEHKDGIMAHVNRRIDDLVPRGKSLLFFDCANCYFETPYNDEYWFRRKAQRILRKELRKEHSAYAGLTDRQLNQIIDDDIELSQLLQDKISALGELLRMNGPSKEKRHDLPLISIALIIDENAIPIDFMVFPGNKAETKTLIESVKNLKDKYKIKNAILVADSALNGTINLSKLLKEKLGFSVARSALTFTNEIRENELDLSTFSPIKDESGNNISMLYKIIEYHNVKYASDEKDEKGKSKKYTVDCKMMLTYSEKRKERDLAVLEENIRRAELAIERKENIMQARTGWKQYVLTETQEIEIEQEKVAEPSEQDKKNSKKKKTVSVTVATALNKNVIEKKRKCAGFAGILFHEPPESKEQFTPAYVSTLYHQLVQIEECFKVMKSDFEIRPLYVRDRNSIEGHVLLCVLALIMLRLIQRKFATAGRTITASQLQDILKELKMMTLFFDDNHCVYIQSQEAIRRNCMKVKDAEYKTGDKYNVELLKQVLDIKLNDSVNTIEQLRNEFKVKSLNRSEYQTELFRKYYVNQS